MELPVLNKEDFSIWHCNDCGAPFIILFPQIRFYMDELQPVSLMMWGNEKSSPACPYCSTKNTTLIKDINFFKSEDEN